MLEKAKSLTSKNIIIYITYTILLTFALFNYSTVIGWLKYILSVFTPLIIALMIAFVLNIPMSKIEKLISKKFDLKKSVLRTISLTLTMILLIIIILVLSYIIVPRLISSIYAILIHLDEYAEELTININAILKNLHISKNYYLKDEITQYVDITKIVSMTNSTGINILFQSFGFISVFITGILTFVMSLYLLSNKEIHRMQARKLTVWLFGKNHSTTIFDLCSEANYYFNGFISGQLVNMVLFAIMIYIPLRLIGLPFTELMAVFVGFCSLIPMFGCYISFFINLVIVLALAPHKLIAYIIIFVIIQQTEANLIYPKVVGKAVGISGLYIILGLSVFGKLFGFMGLLVAVPCMALIYAVFSRLITITLYRRRIEVNENSIDEIEGIDEDIPYTYRGH